MEKTDIEKLRDLPIEGVAELLKLKVAHRRCLCCFHDDHKPSMVLNVRKNTFRCYSCGAHGGVIDLAMKVLGTGFVETCRWLADSTNIIITTEREHQEQARSTASRTFDRERYERYFSRPWLNEAARHFLYEVRHLDERVVRFCRLNSYRDWLQIPYYDQRGTLIGIQQRYLGTDPDHPRFLFPQGEACHLYNQQVIAMLRPDEPIWIAEGPSDAWAMMSAGRKAVAIPSATMLRPHDLLPLARRNCHIAPDADEAGEKLYEKLLTTANDIGFCLIRHSLPEGCKDFSDYWTSINTRELTDNQRIDDTKRQLSTVN